MTSARLRHSCAASPGRRDELPKTATFLPIVSQGGANARAARYEGPRRRTALLGFPLPAAQRIDVRYEKTYRASQRTDLLDPSRRRELRQRQAVQRKCNSRLSKP